MRTSALVAIGLLCAPPVALGQTPSASTPRHQQDERVKGACEPDVTPMSGAELERAFLAAKEKLPTLSATFFDNLAFLRKEDDKERMPAGRIKLGFDSNEAAGADSVFILKTSASFSRGTYPAALTFSSDVNLNVTGKTSQESVSKFASSYEYHVKDFAEVYGFVERFSDNFLDIQQRYETGVGGVIGWNFWKSPMFKSGKEKLDTLLHIAGQNVGNTTHPDGTPKSESYCALYDRASAVTEALRRKYTYFFVGTAFSVFSELEQAKITGWATPKSTPDSPDPKALDQQVDAAHRFRFTVRPTFIARPNADLTVKVYPYFKLPLNGPYRLPVPSGRKLDYRIDWLNDITWNVAKSSTGLEQVGFTLSIHYYFDNVPPRVLDEIVAQQESAGSTVNRVVARNRHTMVSLTMDVGWGK